MKSRSAAYSAEQRPLLTWFGHGQRLDTKYDYYKSNVMGASSLNAVAIAMGKVLKVLKDVEAKGIDKESLEENKETYYVLAYMCRVAIMDRIEENSWMQHKHIVISIPLGLFKKRRETMENAIEITIGKLLSLVSEHEKLRCTVEDILENGSAFDEFERLFPQHVLEKLH